MKNRLRTDERKAVTRLELEREDEMDAKAEFT